jgi:hypothetical protein
MDPRNAFHRRRSRNVLLVSALLLLSSACVTASASRSSGARPLALDVTNRGSSDVIVYLADGAVPSRLGRVGAFERARLLIRRGQGPVRLVLRASGSNDGFVPEPVWADPGQVVELTVQPVLKTSDLVVR